MPINFKTHEEYLNWYREYRKKNRIKLRLYNRQYNKDWRYINGYHNECQWKKNNPIAVKTHQSLYRAIKRGAIKRKPCIKCGSLKSQAHHEDYSDPLKVIWLCAKHHKAHHLKNLKKITLST